MIKQKCRKIIINHDPYENNDVGKVWSERGRWPCSWISGAADAKPPFGIAYSRDINLLETKKFRIHVTADERYELFLDGELIGRGPEQGSLDSWFYETYELELLQGKHNFTALVWNLGDIAPYAQMSAGHGFLLGAENEMQQQLNTGIVHWDSQIIKGINFNPSVFTVTGPEFKIDGSLFPWGIEKCLTQKIKKIKCLNHGVNPSSVNEFNQKYLLRPATLPEQMRKKIHFYKARYVSRELTGKINLAKSMNEEVDLWENLFQHKTSVTLEPGETRRIIIDLDNYYCAYPELTVSRGKGAKLNIAWAEALFTENNPSAPKQSRNEIDQRYFIGIKDSFLPDGGTKRKFNIPWWRSGRYVELIISTGIEPLQIDSLELIETRYPLETESSFETGSSNFDNFGRIALRTLQMCLHETYMDCPYYEQLMYVADTRLQILTNYTISKDSKPVRKAIGLIKSSILPNGLTQSRYPSRVTQIIPPFSLWWIGMAYDYVLWRGNDDFIREIMPSIRYVLDCFSKYLNKEGLLEKLPGWNFVDWTGQWRQNKGRGVPPDAEFGISGVINWQYVYTLRLAADLHSMIGDVELAEIYKQKGRTLANKLTDRFYDDKRELFADTLDKKKFSEHAQCLAILSGYLNDSIKFKVGKALLSSPELTKATIYFSHYLFETFTEINASETLFERLTPYLNIDSLGLKTLLEAPEPSRSDCHAWSAHPLYHFYATIAGIKPAAAEFKRVKIKPMLGSLNKFSAEMIHPAGTIRVNYKKLDNGNLVVKIGLPVDICGEFYIRNLVYPLTPGDNNFTIDSVRPEKRSIKKVSKKALQNVNYIEAM